MEGTRAGFNANLICADAIIVMWFNSGDLQRLQQFLVEQY